MKKTQNVTLWLLILGLAFFTRLLAIPFTPSDWDDWVYRLIGICQKTYGYPSACTVTAGPNPPPFLFHPPFHFKLLEWWITLTGNDSVNSMRVLSCIIAVLLIAVVMYITWYVTKHQIVTYLVGLVLSIDGWFHYSSILVKFDVATCLLGMIAVYFVIRAIEENTYRFAFIAGLFIGFAAIYKHIGVVFFVGVLLQWILTLGLYINWKWRNWRDLRYREWSPHRTIVLTAVCVGIVYVLGMILTYHQLYIDDTLVQVRRMVGLQHARGLTYGPVEAFKALAATYWAFGGTILFALFSVLCVLRRTLVHLRGKDLSLAPITLTADAALVVLVIIKLRNPHYVHYLLVPAYIVACIQISEWLLLFMERRNLKNLMMAVIGGEMILLSQAVNLRTFYIRLTDFSGSDSFVAVQDYVRANFQTNIVILADQSFCDSMPERQCLDVSYFETTARIAAIRPKVIILYETNTQNPPDSVRAWAATGTIVLSSETFKDKTKIVLMP